MATKPKMDACLEVYVADVTIERVDSIAEGIADLLADRGLGTGEEDEQMRSLIIARQHRMPRPSFRFGLRLRRAMMLVIPSAKDHSV